MTFTLRLFKRNILCITTFNLMLATLLLLPCISLKLKQLLKIILTVKMKLYCINKSASMRVNSGTDFGPDSNFGAEKNRKICP